MAMAGTVRKSFIDEFVLMHYVHKVQTMNA